MITKRLIQVICISLFFIASSLCYAGDSQDTSDNLIKFFIFNKIIQDDSGSLQGTEDNYGSGGMQDDSGNVQGTGDDYGSGEIR